jgi:hypothetical protein
MTPEHRLDRAKVAVACAVLAFWIIVAAVVVERVW